MPASALLPLAPKLLYNHVPEVCSPHKGSPQTLDKTMAFQAAKDYILRENQRK